MTTRHYTDPDGVKYPLTEARYPMDFKVYKSDRRKAKQGDPNGCWMALGIWRIKGVIAVYVGSGRDAYVVFAATDEEPARAIHFTIGTTMRRLIDAFDKDRKAKTMKVELRVPAKSWTLEGRRKNNARRRAEVKAGATKKPRGRIAAKRITRIGVGSRHRAPISRTGNLNLAAQVAA